MGSISSGAIPTCGCRHLLSKCQCRDCRCKKYVSGWRKDPGKPSTHISKGFDTLEILFLNLKEKLDFAVGT